MRDFRKGDIIWTKNQRADMNNVYHCTVIGWEIRFQDQKSEVFFKTKNHGWVSEHKAGHTREQALELWLPAV